MILRYLLTVSHRDQRWRQKEKTKPNQFLLLKHRFKRKTRAISRDERWYIVFVSFLFVLFLARLVLLARLRVGVKKFLILNSVFCCCWWRTIFNFSVWYFDCLLIWFHYRWSVFMKTRRKKHPNEEKEAVQKQFQRRFRCFFYSFFWSVLSYNESIGGWLINLLCGEQTTKSSL